MNSEHMFVAVVVLLMLCLTSYEVIDRVLEFKETELAYQSKRDSMELWQPPTIPDCDDPTWDRIINGCEEED